MKKITQYIPLHLSLFLVLGVLFGYYNPIPTNIILIYLLVSLGLLGLLFWLNKSYFQYKWIFQLVSYITIFVIGIVNITIQDSSHQNAHYSHYRSNENQILFQIDKVLKPTLYHTKYYARVLQIDSIQCEGEILLNIKKDSIEKTLRVGEIYITKSKLHEINKPLNPYSFDYSNYLKKQGILHQISVENTSLLAIDIKINGLKIYAARWRDKIQNSLHKYPFQDNEMAIINAIVLGQRQSISKDLLESYAGAGAIHILAVSGLHVGILFLLLSFLFSPLEKLPYGNHIKTLLIVLVLWGFALLTGLSGSVVRAVSMFTFIAIGLSIRNQRSSVLHALITSFFILVLIHPLFIFDVGFQMSYAAVLGIVLLYPKVNALIPRMKWLIPRKIWQLFSVSVTATIGTLPISLYYFHQFPGLFFLSNIVIVPFLGIIMGVGILVVILSLFQFLPSFIVQIYAGVLSLMNAFIEWVAHQEQFLFKNISFSVFALIASYFVIAMGYRWWIERKTARLFTFLIAIVLLQGVFIFEKHQTETIDELIIFHKARESIYGIKEGNKVQILHSFDSIKDGRIRFINNYKVGLSIKELKFVQPIPNVMMYNKNTILIVDSLEVYQDIPFKPNIVLLRQSPRINLERLLQEYQPKTLIADGSNYKSYVSSWRETCLRNDVKFHYTGVEGAYVLKQ